MAIEKAGEQDLVALHTLHRTSGVQFSSVQQSILQDRRQASIISFIISFWNIDH
jgi:hypothetical protein